MMQMHRKVHLLAWWLMLPLLAAIITLALVKRWPDTPPSALPGVLESQA
ncbi:MAG: hypothetical protein AAFX85_15400 [Pseudomonadota bacterium]